MSTPTPDDPYAQPASNAGSQATPGTTPAAPASPAAPPPPMPGQAPPPGAFAPAGWAPEPPHTLALATIILTGVYALTQLLGSFMAQGSVEDAKAAIETGDTSINPAGTLLQFLSFAVMLAAFVVLAMWMARIRKNLAQQGINAGGPPHVEWWGWFVPLANFVLPLLGMRAIARRKVGMGPLLGWWLPWCLVWIVSVAAQVTSVLAIDFQTGEITNSGALDASVPLAYAATAATIVSWIFLTVIVRRVTARHLED